MVKEWKKKKEKPPELVMNYEVQVVFREFFNRVKVGHIFEAWECLSDTMGLNKEQKLLGQQ